LGGKTNVSSQRPRKAGAFSFIFYVVVSEQTTDPEEVMQSDRAMELLTRAGAFKKGHFVFTSGRHSSTYINKDSVYPYTRMTDELCKALALAFEKEKVHVVAAPEKGAIVLGQGVARWLQCWNTLSINPEILSVYADKMGEEFIFKRGYELLIPQRNVLVVEDLLTTGSSAKRTVQAVRALGGNIVGVGAMVNRGGVKAEMLEVPRLVSLVDIDQPSYPADSCPLCTKGVPIDPSMGHGKKYLESR
jgi:orotate phosphoribosyltransferase